MASFYECQDTFCSGILPWARHSAFCVRQITPAVQKITAGLLKPQKCYNWVQLQVYIKLTLWPILKFEEELYNFMTTNLKCQGNGISTNLFSLQSAIGSGKCAFRVVICKINRSYTNCYLISPFRKLKKKSKLSYVEI